MQCEMCGSEGGLQKVKIEGAILSVCSKCSKLGTKIKTKQRKSKKSFERKPINEPNIHPNFSEKIRNAREEKDLTRKQLSQKLNIKKSELAHLEKGKHLPKIKLAKKLEKTLDIEILGYTPDKESYSSKKTKPLTLGDVATIKKKSN